MNLFEIDFSNIQRISLIEINIMISVLVLGILFTRLILKKRAPKRFFGVLWGIAAIRLLIPFSVPLMNDMFPPDYYTFFDIAN